MDLADRSPLGPQVVEHDVGLLELFFDLVFVFGISQLSRHLVTHLVWRGMAETLVMLLAILLVWSYTSWEATLRQAHPARTRWMIFTIMGFGLFMNAAITRAFTASGWSFVIPFLAIQLGRTVWTIVHSRSHLFRNHYGRVLLWMMASIPLWVAGACLGPDAKLLYWGLAAGLDLTGTWLAHPIPGRRLRSERVAFDADHMLERCRLFLLIALGETVVTTGTAIAAAPFGLMVLATGASALIGTIALWTLVFGRAHRLIMGHLEQTQDPIRSSRYAVNVMMVLVAGLIAVAVANAQVIAHPLERPSGLVSLLLTGGPLLFMAGQGWYLVTVLEIRPWLQGMGGLLILAVGLATSFLPPYAALVGSGAVLAILAMIDQRRCASDIPEGLHLKVE